MNKSFSPAVVRIVQPTEGPPQIEVTNAPFGYNIHVGPLVNNPSVEQGALINLCGVDHLGSVASQGWRFVDPKVSPEATRNGLHIVWIAHDDSGPFCNGDLQIGFNSVLPGYHYTNPIHTKDKDLGTAGTDWITVYSDEALVLLFKAGEREP